MEIKLNLIDLHIINKLKCAVCNNKIADTDLRLIVKNDSIEVAGECECFSTTKMVIPVKAIESKL